MPSSRRDTVHQFIRFFIVGVSNTAVDFTVYFLLTRTIGFFGEHILVANTISFITASTWSYFANRTFTFRRKNKASVHEALRFYISNVSAFALSMFTLYSVVHIFGESDILGKILASTVSMIWNFSLSKLWVFSR